MGSGLILLVIVGAWLAVLVPMVLRSHESSTSLNTVDKFQDAMRVLSRRHPSTEPDEAEDDVPEAGPPARRVTSRRLPRPGTDPGTGWARPDTAGPPRARPAPAPPASQARRATSTRLPRSVPPARPVTARRSAGRWAGLEGLSAVRRRRILLALLAAAGLTLAGALTGPLWLVAPHLAVDLLVVGFVVHLRRTALRLQRERRAARQRERAAQKRRAPRARRAAHVEPAERVPAERVPVERMPAERVPEERAPLSGVTVPGVAVRPARPLRVAGVPDRMPSRYAVLGTPLPQRPVVEDDAAGSSPRGAQGGQWSPVPVPPPIYLSTATIPPRPERRGDPERSDGVAAAERELGIDDSGPELGEILHRRKAAND